MNVASEWPIQNRNYPSFRELYQKYHDQGFEIIAFPANQFGGQAPGTDEEERAWALKKFGIDFDVFDHIAVLDKPTPMWAGPTEISPLYRYLKSQLPGEVRLLFVVQFGFAVFIDSLSDSLACS